MPETIFDTAGSSDTYTVPAGVQEVAITCEGAGGGSGGSNSNGNGGAGANGGSVRAVSIPVTPGEVLDVYVGAGGGGGNWGDGGFASGNPGAGGGPSWNPGGNGGGGGDDTGAGGGGGGGPSAVVDSGGNVLIVGAGGGGGGGEEGTSSDGGGGGGGGARGGLGGTGGLQGESFPGGDGQPGSGTGQGGDGGDGGGFSGADGSDGGYVVNAGTTTFSNVGGGSTGGSSPSASTAGNNGTGGSVTIITAPPAPSLSLQNITTTSIDLDIGDTSEEDGVRIFRREDGGSYSEIADLGAGTVPTTYSDTGLSEGQEYDYYAEAYNAEGASQSSTETGTTLLPAPTLDSVTNTSGDDIAVQWSENSSDEDGYRVYRSRDGGASFTEAADVSNTTTSYNDTGLLDGEEYTYEVRGYTAYTERASSRLAATTVLPDAQTPAADTNTEDEITWSWADVTDYGNYDLEMRETNESAQWGSTVDLTLSESTTSYTATGLEDGERYDVRIRTRTEHVTGAWVETDAITILPAPSGISASNKSATQQDINWTDNSDNEDVFVVERQEKLDSGYTAYSTIATVGPNVTSITDSNISPDTTYRYRVTVSTEHISASATAEITTGALEFGRREADRSHGWSVLLEASNGDTRRIPLSGNPQFIPKLNALPEVVVPTEKDESLDLEKWEDAEMRVWQEGKRLPIEQVKEVNQMPGMTEITGLGGVELLKLASVEYDNTDAHAEAGPLVEDNTSYTAVVDSPDASSQLLQNVDHPDEFNALYNDPGIQTPVVIDTTGVVPDDTGIQLAQTCFLEEAEDHSGISTFVNDLSPAPDWSDNLAVGVPGDTVTLSIDITLDYEIPAGEVGVALHRQYESFNGTWSVSLDGQTLAAFDTGGSTIDGDDASWNNVNTGVSGTEWTSSLSTGSHTVEVTASGSGNVYVDTMALFDQRYHTQSNFDDSPQDYHTSPSLYPTGGIDVVLEYNNFQPLNGATIDNTTWSDTSGAQAMALSIDSGSTYTSCSNCSTLDVDFGDSGPTVLMKFTLDAWGSRNDASPTQGFNTQTLREFDLSGDLRDSPAISNETYNNNISAILTNIADAGYALWEVTWDDTNGIQVEFSNAGQRSHSGIDFNIFDYEWNKKTLGRQVERAIIRGGAQRVSEETVVADHNVHVDLASSNLIPGRETVYSSDRSTRYSRGSDYEMGYLIGTVQANSGGNISDGETLSIDYEWKPEGEYSVPSPDPKKEIDKTVPNVLSNNIAKRVAYYIIQVASDPVEGGEATLDELPPGWSLLDAFAADPIPSKANEFHVSGVSVRQGSVTLQLQSRRPTTEIINDINASLRTVEDRV